MRLLTARETAEQLQVTRARVYEMARVGLLPSIRMGRQVRFDEGALKQWVERGGSADRSSLTKEPEVGGRR
jgi:excisionase family DNA binding protein